MVRFGIFVAIPPPTTITYPMIDRRYSIASSCGGNVVVWYRISSRTVGHSWWRWYVENPPVVVVVSSSSLRFDIGSTGGDST